MYRDHSNPGCGILIFDQHLHSLDAIHFSPERIIEEGYTYARWGLALWE